MVRRLIMASIMGLGLVASGCGGGGEDVSVTLQEFAVGADPSSVSAGSVTFNIENIGPDDTHEFVVIRTDLDPTELPTDENGAVDEAGAGIEVVDEVEEIPVGDTPTLTIDDLTAGSYVLICNVFDEAENEAHYSEGMRTGFTVS
jgi:uncharacterized cupredoxin-like copper-binding protein